MDLERVCEHSARWVNLMKLVCLPVGHLLTFDRIIFLLKLVTSNTEATLRHWRGAPGGT